MEFSIGLLTLNYPENHHAYTNWDKVGITVSTLCFLHCLLVPISIAVLPVVAVGLIQSEWIHIAFVALAVPVAMIAQSQGYKRHGSPIPVLVAAFGLTFLGAALLVHDIHWLETGLTGIGAGMVAASHLANHRMSGRSKQ